MMSEIVLLKSGKVGKADVTKRLGWIGIAEGWGKGQSSHDE